MNLSIIIPVYNAEKYLNQCVLSIISYDSEELEVILVNNGSEDSSFEICKELQNKDKRIKVINEENRGVSIARNRGLSEASGKYIMFLDADDYILEDKMNIVFSYIEKNYDFVGFSYMSLFPSGKVIDEPFKLENNEKTSCNIKEINKILLGSPLLHTCWGRLFKLNIIKENNIEFPVGIKIGEDYMFVLEYFKHTKTPILVNESILNYRQNPNGAMGSFNYKLRIEMLELIYKYCYKYINELNLTYLINDFYYYHFRSLTNFLLNIAENDGFFQCYKYYKKNNEYKFINEILNKVSTNKLSLYKKYEYFLIKHKLNLILCIYFKIKRCLRH